MTDSNVANNQFSRLPEIAKPLVYDIYLKPNFETFEFSGHVAIVVEITSATNILQLHASEMEIHSIDIKLENGTKLEISNFDFSQQMTMLTLYFLENIEPQNILLTIDFMGEHNNKMKGFYRSFYKGTDGSEKILLSTQFETTFARRAFPCWDEPIYKAKFNVTLEVDEKFIALSNMNIISETSEGNGKKIVKYAETPLMSSYLVAFAVGEFEHIQAKAKNGCLVRVFATEGKSKQGEYALDLAIKALDYYTEWFGIEYPLPKCDLLAVPDFTFGGMENWGLVIFREFNLLYDPVTSSGYQQMRLASCLCHEISHFWFGDLVTMKWWDNLWLKEGFASFMQYYVVALYCPQMEIWKYFIDTEWSKAIALDAFKSSHPIEIPINNPNELEGYYDAITYAKSNSVIRMLFSYLNEPKFQDGLRRYLKKFQYGNTVAKDLWDAFSEASSGEDISKMMSTWTQQMGFPLVTVEEQKIVDGQKRILKLKQSRFIANGENDDSNSLWVIPITVTTASSPDKPIFNALMDKFEQEFIIENVNPEDWLKINFNTTGFYRVQYCEEMLKSLMIPLQNKTLPVLDRFGIANDLFALVKAGKTSANQFLDLVSASSNEDEYVVWEAIDEGIGSLANVFGRHENKNVKEKLDEFVLKIYEPILERIQWEASENEPMMKSMLRSLIINRLASSGHQKTIDTILQEFNNSIENNSELNADLRPIIYGIVAKKGEKDGNQKLRGLYENAKFSEVERNCISAMAQAGDEKILEDFLNFAVKQEKVRIQDLYLIFDGAKNNSISQNFAWNYLQENISLFIGKFGSVNSQIFQRLFKSAVDSQSDFEFAESFEKTCKKMFNENQLKVLEHTIGQCLENIRLNAQLLKNNARVAEEYFNN